jgi:hypothetical protein
MEQTNKFPFGSKEVFIRENQEEKDGATNKNNTGWKLAGLKVSFGLSEDQLQDIF